MLRRFLATFLIAPLLTLVATSLPAYALDLVLCSESDSLPQLAGARNFFGPDGHLLPLAVTSVVPDDDSQCESLELPARGGELLWSGLVEEDIARIGSSTGYLLQGRFEGVQQVTVSDVAGLGSPTQTVGQAVSLGEDLLAASRNFVFGEEDRASWSAITGLSCAPGDRPAGVQFLSVGKWPVTRRGRLYIEASGDGQFQFSVADLSRIEGEAPLEIGELSFAASDALGVRLIDLPESDLNWQALTVLCPNSAASLDIKRVAVLASASGVGNAPVDHRSAWLWAPEVWREDEAMIWQIVAEQNLHELYLTIPVESGDVKDQAPLEKFLASAHARGIQVWPVIGDRRDVFRSNWTALQTRIRSYARFNSEQAPDRQLQGVQLDIEPYLLAGFALDPDYWKERYLDTVAYARASVGPFLNIDLVVPVWWGTHPQFGAEFLARLTPFRVSLTVMNYRTDTLQLLRGAEPFLDWGDNNNRKVSIGLEVGSVVDEEQQLFRPDADAGELWQLTLGEHSVLALFEEKVADLQGLAFTRYLSRPYAGGNISFAGDLDRLNRIARFLSASLSGREAFRGVSLHGLDEVYRESLAD